MERLPANSGQFEKYAGTPEYMAPEVNEGKYSYKADIYSLGLSLVELLTVQKPYKECEGALNIYVNKKKGIMPESFSIITDRGIREFIMLCLNSENKRPTAKEILEKNKWLNDKNVSENNSIIEIKGALRQKNFYLNNRYKSGANIDMQKSNLSNKNIIKYNSKMFNNFNLISKKSFQTNYNKSGIIKNNFSFSFKNNVPSATTSRTDNLASNRTTNFHLNDEEIHNTKVNNNSNNSINYSNNVSREYSDNNLVNLNMDNINAINCDLLNSNNSIVNKPIIKEKRDSNVSYGLNMFNPGKNIQKKYSSPEQNNNKKKINIPHLNFGFLSNVSNKNNNQRISSFRETMQCKINNNSNSSSIKSIIIHSEENEYNDNCDSEENNYNDYYINYNIIYTIKFMDNKSITCEYNYEKDTVDLIINDLKEIMNIDANDIILLKNEFAKKINGFIDKKKLQIFFNKYNLILNKFKMIGNVCKKFGEIINGKNFIYNDKDKFNSDIENNKKLIDILEKIKDYQMKRNIINSININSKK